MAENDQFNLMNHVRDPRYTSANVQAAMHIGRQNGQFSIRYIDEASGQVPAWVTMPDNQPFLVETLIDLNNDRISVWVDGVPQDATVDLSGYQSINRADLVLANLDSGT